MPHYLVSGYSPRQLRPIFNDRSDGTRYQRAQRRVGSCRRQALRWRPQRTQPGEVAAACSPMAKCSSPTARIWKPRSTLVVFRSLKPPTWTRRWRGAASLSSPAGCRSRCARSHTATCRAAHLTHRASESREPPTGETGSSSDLDNGLGDGNIRIALVRGCRVPSHSPSPSRPRDVSTEANLVGARTSNQCRRTGIEGAISRATAGGTSADWRMVGTRSRR